MGKKSRSKTKIKKSKAEKEEEKFLKLLGTMSVDDVDSGSGENTEYAEGSSLDIFNVASREPGFMEAALGDGWGSKGCANTVFCVEEREKENEGDAAAKQGEYSMCYVCDCGSFSLQEKHKLYRMFLENMKELYERSSGGFDEEDKIKEFFERDSRYFVVRDGAGSGEIVGYMQFRYCYDVDTEDEEGRSECLYIFELQISRAHQSKGIGGALVNALKGLAKQSNLKMSLTAFKHNPGARRFYGRHGFVVDEKISPAEDDEEDYLILSKFID